MMNRFFSSIRKHKTSAFKITRLFSKPEMDPSLEAEFRMQELLQGSGFENLMDLGQNEARLDQLNGFLESVATQLETENCRGCGSQFQFESENNEGFVDMNQFLLKSDEKEEYSESNFLNYLIEEEQDTDGMFTVEDYMSSRQQNLPDLDTIKKFLKEKGNHDAVCQRCQFISSGKLAEASKIKIDTNSKYLKSNEEKVGLISSLT